LAASRKNVDDVGDGESLSQVLFDKKDCGSGLDGRPDRQEEPTDDQRRETKRQLINDQHVGISRQGATKHQHLLLATRQ
jgi:hypothetical protein